MIFDAKSLDDISEHDIDTLVWSHASERQHLEFKADWDYQSDEARLELLKDIAALANGGGGYLFIGIRDDGKGRAQRLESLSAADAAKKSQILRGICLDHISERIDGLEVRDRSIRGHAIVAVRIPPSDRAPHMVSFHHHTYFGTRTEDGKREMSFGEIRSAFLDGPLGRRLFRLESAFERFFQQRDKAEQKGILETAMESKASQPPSGLTDGELVSLFYQRRFHTQIGATPEFWMLAVPSIVNPEALHLSDERVLRVFRDPPGSRESGWSMAGPRHFTPNRTAEGIEVGAKDFMEYLILRKNMALEFWTPLDQHFCWRQSPAEFQRRPRLYPYPVAEYPTTFLRLYKALLDAVSIRTRTIFRIEYRNVHGYVLKPGAPGTPWFEMPRVQSVGFAEPHLTIGPAELGEDFHPDHAAYDIIAQVYEAFGLEASDVPFYDPATGFTFSD
jgi:Schlafen, AlbA_2